jgi:membrane protein YqaA with SNARE-associated domain
MLRGFGAAVLLPLAAEALHHYFILHHGRAPFLFVLVLDDGPVRGSWAGLAGRTLRAQVLEPGAKAAGLRVGAALLLPLRTDPLQEVCVLIHG